MEAILAGLAGLAAGAHVATWGMYKDAIHEGFTAQKYSRSIIVGIVVALLLHFVLGIPADGPASLTILFGLAYVAERGLVEVYKTFIRTEDQSKYFIPMQFHIMGRVVESQLARAGVGLLYVAAVGAAAAALEMVNRHPPAIPRLALVLLVGTVGGWISAVGGAWKDAPIEGFETFKFFRSPAITAAYALLLAPLTQNYLYISLAALGYTIATIETYKTFYKSDTPRGKFAGKPIHFPHMLHARRAFIPIYALIWIGMIATGALALREVMTAGGVS